MILDFMSTDIRMNLALFRGLIPALILIGTSSVPLQADLSTQRDPSRQGQSTRISDFSLPTTDSVTISLPKDPTIEFTVLCFLGTECPLAKLYGPRLQQLANEFSERGVQFIGINSNIQDSMDEVAEYGRQHGITFPLAKDYDRTVAMNLGATRTPEVFIVDREVKIRYQGRIDDQYEPGIAKKNATQHDLQDAINDLVSGDSVRSPRTTAVGCLIALPRKTASNSKITFCDQVIRVLRRNCTECHRSGEIGPFALDNYDEAIGWADMSLEVIEQKRMPPWHADSKPGVFANARHMSEEDKAILRDWVDSGMPFGDAKNLPPPQEKVDGWRLPRQPDKVLSLYGKAPSGAATEEFKGYFSIPASGTVEYQYYVVDPELTEDTWVRAAQVLPGNAAVVHHCIVWIRPPDGSDFRNIGFLAGHVPGQVRNQFPDGYAQKIAAGSKLVFQMHYTPTGKPETDNTKLGLVFTEKESVTHQVRVLIGINQNLEIPPGAAEHAVHGRVGGYARDGLLLSVTPHMHLRGKSFRLKLLYADNRIDQLLHVPAYDFNWQHNYDLRKPIPLSDVTDIRFTATFDNSANNPFNPNPDERVYWGDQTDEEMALTLITVAEPLVADQRSVAKIKTKRKLKAPLHTEQKQQLASVEKRATEYAKEYMKRLDANGDGFVSEREMPNALRVAGRGSLDKNRDRRLSLEEIKAEAIERFRRSDKE